ncbi:zinc finger BED domain-containing protein 6-like [Pseudonaja textilis]|uniref:zinc finger BED domain-containing protein 6-like n=1 Tax=Pseudonaja textilis TaxID=8673 RepID=UPI000EA95D3F|nr:zinc finger BED domain-containing protein 6-like [Pseudonaja textilis]
MMPRRGRGRRLQLAAFNRRTLPVSLQRSPFSHAMEGGVSDEPLDMVVAPAGSLEPGVKEETPYPSSVHDLFSYLKEKEEEEEEEVDAADLGSFSPSPSVSMMVKQHCPSEVHEMLSYLKKEEEEEEEVAKIASLSPPRILPLPAPPSVLPAYASTATLGRSILPGGKKMFHYFTPVAHLSTSAPPKRGHDQAVLTDGVPPYVQKKTTSAVWDYFTLDPREPCVAVCSMCQKRVRRGKDGGTRPGTTALHKHLKVHHGLHLPGVAVVPPSLLMPLKEKSHRTPMLVTEPSPPIFPFAQPESNQPYYPPTHPTAIQLASSTAWMLAVDMQPFSWVESEGFRRLMATAQPRWRIPSRAFFTTKAVPELSKVVSRAVRQTVACSVGRTVHITIDTWGERQTAMYMSVTGHWIADLAGTLARQHATLSVCTFEGCCAPEDICHKLQEVLQDWLYDLKTGSVVADSGTNTARAVRELHLNHAPCLARCLKLVTKAFLARDSQVGRLLKTSRRICSCYHRSATVRQRLLEVQANLGLPQPLGPSAQARSISTLLMLECLYRQRRAIVAMLDEDEDDSHLLLAPADWKVMKCLVEILKPFEDATALLIQPDATLCQALPLLWFLEEQLRALRTRYYQENNNTAAHLTTQALDCLEADNQLREIKDSMMYRIAAFLDPRFRDITTMKLGGTNLSDAALLKEHIVGLATRSYVPPGGAYMEFSPVSRSSQEQNASSGSSAAWEFTMKRWRAITKSDPASSLASEGGAAVALREMEEYLHDNVDHIGENADPMLYWQGKMATWPSLFKVAVFHFGCPPTSSSSSEEPCSAPSSLGPRDHTRNLSPANVTMFTFIRRNRHLIPQDWRLSLGDLSSQSPLGPREDLSVEEEDDLLRLDEEQEDK